MAIIWIIPQSYVVASAVLLAIKLALSVFNRKTPVVDQRVPVIGVGSGLLARQIASLRSFWCMHDWLAEGYRKYAPGAFKVRSFQEWLVVVTGPQLIDELRRAPDDVLSLQAATGETLMLDLTLSPMWRDHSAFHLSLLKKLTREIPQLFPGTMEEINAAFTDEVSSKLNGNAWTTLPLPISETIMRIVCRTTNRVFVGRDKCRDPEYINLNSRFPRDVIISASIMKLFPSYLRPLVLRFLTPVPRTLALAKRVMTAFIEERLRQSSPDDPASSESHPNDLLQWIIDSDERGHDDPERLIVHILALNFGAIHTTSMTFICALYHIAAEPEKYQTPIRKEVHDVVSRYGWTKTAMDKLHRLDSLFRETLRCDSFLATGVTRKAMKDFSLSDGTQVWQGDTVACAVRATHYDNAIYPDAEVFDGFRFYTGNPDEEDDGKPLSNRLVSTSFDFLAFGTGKHACPGRFWAENDMKAMMAYMVTHYDMKMEHEGMVPRGMRFGTSLVPDLKARLVVRKREVQTHDAPIV